MISYPRPSYDFQKIRILIKNNITLIFAGSGEVETYERIIDIIDEDIKEFKDDIIDVIELIFKDYLRKYLYVDSVYDRKSTTRFFVFMIKDGDIQGYLITKSGVEILSTAKNKAIGCGVRSIIPQLEIETYYMDFNDVKQFGLDIMKYSQINNDSQVGDPEEDGCDYVHFFNSHNYILTYKFKPNKFDISKMLYRFDDENEQ